MIYFVNEYLMALNSGIEHAEFKRLQLFRHQGIDAKLVTRNFDQIQYVNKQKFGIADDQIVNMYDFFQGVTDRQPVGKNEPKIETLNLADEYNIDPGADVTHVYEGDQLVMDVRFAPGTVGQLYSVDVYDRIGHRVQTTLWDFRGFKSRDQFFSTTGELVSQITYNPAGERVIEETFNHNQDGQHGLALIELPNYQNQDLFFNSYDELFTYFLDELNRLDAGKAIFVADRPGAVYESILAMKSKAKRFVSLPTTHTVDVNDQVYANLSGLYANALVNHVDQLDGIIVATEDQKADLTRWMGGSDRVKAPITAIPYSVVSDEQVRAASVHLIERTQHKVIVVGRLTRERHVEDVVAAFTQVKQRFADATLDIYGYGDQEAALRKQIQDAQLDTSVTLMGYQVELDDVYNHAQVYVNATEGDSEPLALAEALSHGVPSVVYDVHYGPANLVANRRDGFLVQPGDISGLATGIIAVLKDDVKWQQMSQRASDSVRAQGETNVISKWKQALKW